MFYYDRINPAALEGWQLDELLALGWYRMHQTLFTTSHVDLGELYRVHWLRYDLHTLVSHRSHRRIQKNFQGYRCSIERFKGIAPSHHELHQRYRASISFDGALSIAECLFGDGETSSTIFDTHCVSVYHDERLVAAGYFDTGATAAASILHFFDPDYQRLSPGKFLMLATVDYLRRHGYQWYYPGYVVQGLSKMDYKLFLGREQAEYFEPLQAQWLPFRESILQPEADQNPSLPS